MEGKGMRKIQRNYQITQPGFNILKKASKLSGVSMSQIIEKAVMEYVTNHNILSPNYMKMVAREV